SVVIALLGTVSGLVLGLGLGLALAHAVTSAGSGNALSAPVAQLIVILIVGTIAGSSRHCGPPAGRHGYASSMRSSLPEIPGPPRWPWQQPPMPRPSRSCRCPLTDRGW